MATVDAMMGAVVRGSIDKSGDAVANKSTKLRHFDYESLASLLIDQRAARRGTGR